MNSQESPKDLEKICMHIPKAEMHIHIEGSFEPELMLAIAKRNNIAVPYKSIDEVKQKYDFKNLQEFLDIYYSNCNVLLHQQDFEDLMYAYINKASSQGLKYAEIFFDPQTHLKRGVSFETFLSGFKSAMKKGREKFGVETHLIMCFLRDLPEADALEVFEMALPFKSDILGIGLDSAEIGNPPELFRNVFALGKKHGFRLCCHAGEEGPAEYIKQAIDIGAERIDHGIRVFDSEEIMKLCAQIQIPFTLCPLSNLKLKVYPDLSKYPVKQLIQKNLLVMLNSDDPAYFTGYVGDNYVAIMKACGLTYDEVVLLAKNSFKATFMVEDNKVKYIQSVDDYLKDA